MRAGSASSESGSGALRVASGRAALERRERHPQVLADDARDREAAADGDGGVGGRADGTDHPVGGRRLHLARVARRAEERARRTGEIRVSGEQLAGRVEDRSGAHIGGQLVHVLERQRWRQGRRHRRRAE